MLMQIESDAWAHGQIESKIWLCHHLEEHHTHYLPKDIAIYGGWYGLTAFLLFSRGHMQIRKIRSYDIDPICEPIADKINNTWQLQDWKFKAFTADCNDIIWTQDSEWIPNIIINTATEHFVKDTWWTNIPNDMFVVLQGTNMEENDHVSRCTSLDDFMRRFHMRTVYFAGTKSFSYPDKIFNRFMMVGKK